jgi:hypothetical protein
MSGPVVEAHPGKYGHGLARVGPQKRYPVGVVVAAPEAGEK